MPQVLGSTSIGREALGRMEFHLFKSTSEAPYQTPGIKRRIKPVSALRALWGWQLHKSITAKYCG